MKIDDREFYFVTGLCCGSLIIFVLFTLLLLPASAEEWNESGYGFDYYNIDDVWVSTWKDCWYSIC